MEKPKQQPYTFDTANKLADLIGGYVDEPNRVTPRMGGNQPFSNPTYFDDPRYRDFAAQLQRITGAPFYSNVQGSPNYNAPFNAQQFAETVNPPSYRGIRAILPQSGGDYSVLQTGRIPNWEPLQQMFLGEMIRRGYPVLGGTGQMPGFEPGFNPVGFGQR